MKKEGGLYHGAKVPVKWLDRIIVAGTLLLAVLIICSASL